MRKWLFWCIVVTLYWTCVVHVLRASSPVFFDGGGPMPSFYWSKGRAPTPGMGEYNKNQKYYVRLFSLPYYTAALVITVAGCGIAPWVARRWARRRNRLFFISAGATFLLMCIPSLVLDVGEMLRWWMGPRILLIEWRYFDGLVLLKMFVPPSILSGAVAVGLELMIGAPTRSAAR